MTTWINARASEFAGTTPGRRKPSASVYDRAAVALALTMMAVTWIVAPMAAMPAQGDDRAGTAAGTGLEATSTGVPSETFLAFFIGHPWYYRSDVHLTRPDGTDMIFKDMGWDGDAFYFPIDGGVRAARWHGETFGSMIDFYHSKAIARLGKGAHGRKMKNPVIETVETTGTLKGQPAPAQLKLTDLFERLEFTHGHNVLLATGLVRMGGFSALSIRPYAGFGAGAAIPHTEVRFKDEKHRTTEYQYGGPAWQLMFGLELRRGNLSYLLEYKFTYAWIDAEISGDKSWMNWDMPGDLFRQTMRWWRGEEPKYGRVSTHLGSHNVFLGIGYWLQGRAPATK